MSSLLPAVNNPIAPIKPIKIPMAFISFVFDLNSNTPNKSVKSGVNEFSIPVKELLIPVSALVNKKAGIKFPNKPIPKNPFQCLIKSFLKCLINKGDKNKKAMNILNAATSSLEKTSSPRFININELPQVKASAMSIIQLRAFVFKGILLSGQR